MGYIFDALRKSPFPTDFGPVGQHTAASYKLQLQSPTPRPGTKTVQTGEVPPTTTAAPKTKPPGRPTPLDSTRVDDRLIAFTDPSSAVAEEYRSIRSGLLARWQQRVHLVHAITSALPQEGKTLTCLNLGLSLAELKDRKTIVVEADLRHPRFASLLSLPPSPGLSDVLTGKAQLSDVVTCFEGCGLCVLHAGSGSQGQPLQLLSSPKMQAAIAQLRQQFDHVLIDTPPALDVADPGVVGAMCDEVLLVAKASQTPMTLIEQALRNLSQYSLNLAGAIVTGQRRPRRPHTWAAPAAPQPRAALPQAQAA